MSEQPSFSTLPDGVEPIVAWRSWSVSFDEETGDPTLISPVFPAHWKPGEAMVAACKRNPKEACLGDDRCGLYALRSRLGIEEVFLWAIGVPVPLILGTVELWGKVIEGETGFRAQYGYPHELFLPKRLVPEHSIPYSVDELARRLSERYQIRVTVGYRSQMSKIFVGTMAATTAGILIARSLQSRN